MKNMQIAVRFLATISLAGLLSGAAQAKKLNVITATTDMAALTQEVGGDRVSVESMARGYQDPHFVEAKPSFLLKLRQADLPVTDRHRRRGRPHRDRDTGRAHRRSSTCRR